MRALCFFWACVACVGQGRRVQLTTRTAEPSKTSRELARLLVTSARPSAAWHTGAQGVSVPVRGASLARLAARRSSSPHLLKNVDVRELPARPPMAPAVVVGNEETSEETLEEIIVLGHEQPLEDKEEVHERTEEAVPGSMDYEIEIKKKGNKSKVNMDKLKSLEDEDEGLASIGAKFLTWLDSTGKVRRRLWTRADFMHIHAVSGAYFLFLGIPWLFYSHIVAITDPSVPMERSSWFLTSLLLSGLVNALSAIPMSRFSSNKMFDLTDLKANGFTFGGTGLTVMCLWVAWWFSGDYPEALHQFDMAFFALWTAVCVGTTVNWETMLQQNFEANERSGRKFAKVSKEEMQQKSILYRLASWPNLTQLMFMWSIPFGGVAWLQSVTEKWPMEATPMYHYGIASAMGYALSMFSETLRDRKLVSLQTDLLILIIGFIFPMISVVVDGLTYGSAVTISPLEYWALFGAPHLAAAAGA